VIPLSTELDSSGSSRELRVGLYSFAREALEQKAAQLDVSVEELVRFAVLYYLADDDSGRIARRLPSLSSPDQPPPLNEAARSLARRERRADRHTQHIR
jgi:hypothetical protein